MNTPSRKNIGLALFAALIALIWGARDWVAHIWPELPAWQKVAVWGVGMAVFVWVLWNISKTIIDFII